MVSVEVSLSSGKTMLKEGMALCSPSHGIGRVECIEEKEILGEKCVFCKINFQADGMNVMIPVGKMKSMGIRTIISADNAKKILSNVLDKRAKNAKGVWTKRMQEYEMKLYSGNAIFIAEVVRDLFAGMKDPNKSYGERAIYDKAFDRLVLEFSLALNITIEEANKMITDVLNSNYASTHKNDVLEQDILEDNDDFDDDDIDDMDDENESVSRKKSA